MSGFRYVLELENREPADPAMFITALPPGMWKPGDEFMAASDLRQFRVVDFAELENPDVEFVHGVWIIEPVEGRLRPRERAEPQIERLLGGDSRKPHS